MTMENENKIWVDDEIEILKQFYTLYGSEYCAKKLQRDRKAIVKKANRLKIKFIGVRYKYSKESIEPIVITSKSFKEVLEKMFLRAAGGNYQIIKNYIKKYGIDITHFETASERMLKKGKQKIVTPLSEVMVEHSKYGRTELKRRLYKEGLKKRECELCGQGELWKGKKMSLILDHINGVYNDNRMINLRIVCPNCNATLDTHCGKHNRKKEKIIKIKTQQKPKIITRKFKRPSLQQLQNEVAAFGYSGTGRKYGVSDNSIRKWIKSYEKYGI